MAGFRIETDTIGEISVPGDQLWGAQTQRSIENFPIGSQPMPRGLIRALALVKKAACLANVRLGVLDPKLGHAIAAAADEVIAGKMAGSFPLVPWQSGSGTQTNMNMNEVLANRANQLLGQPLGAKSPVHPNDHVNKSQSTNDAFPTAMHVATATQLMERLLPVLTHFAKTLRTKAAAYADVVKIGRTHLQDATPLTSGQEIGAWAAQVEAGAARLEACLPELYQLAQGGTAVGTGLNAPKGFDVAFAEELATLTGLSFVPAPDKFAALAGHDALVAASGAMNVLATALMKIANDVRLLASGPRSGFAELILPANEPGSSIMPGKVNPTQAESVTMVCCQVMGNHVTVSIAGASGHLQLNVFKPVIIVNVLQSGELLADAVESFDHRCIAGMEVDRQRVADLAERSLMLVTALAPKLGYDRAAQVAKKAHVESLTLREAAMALGWVTPEDFDAWVRIEKMV